MLHLPGYHVTSRYLQGAKIHLPPSSEGARLQTLSAFFSSMHVALTHVTTNQLINKSPRLPHLIFDQHRNRLGLEIGFRCVPILLRSTYFVSFFFFFFFFFEFRTLPRAAPHRDSTIMVTDYLFRTLASLGVSGLLYVSCNLL